MEVPRLTLRVTPWMGRPGEDGRRRISPRRRQPEAEKTRTASSNLDVPRRLLRRGGRGKQGASRGGVGVVSGGRSRRRARRRRAVDIAQARVRFCSERKREQVRERVKAEASRAVLLHGGGTASRRWARTRRQRGMGAGTAWLQGGDDARITENPLPFSSFSGFSAFT